MGQATRVSRHYFGFALLFLAGIVLFCVFTVQSEILREADAMASLDHPCIVRLYGKQCLLLCDTLPTGGFLLHQPFTIFSLPLGICVANPIRLVMEIASLGPLNKFLRRHQ